MISTLKIFYMRSRLIILNLIIVLRQAIQHISRISKQLVWRCDENSLNLVVRLLCLLLNCLNQLRKHLRTSPLIVIYCLKPPKRDKLISQLVCRHYILSLHLCYLTVDLLSSE